MSVFEERKQVLRAEEHLLALVNTETRPLPSYVYLTEDVTRCHHYVDL